MITKSNHAIDWALVEREHDAHLAAMIHEPTEKLLRIVERNRHESYFVELNAELERIVLESKTKKNKKSTEGTL